MKKSFFPSVILLISSCLYAVEEYRSVAVTIYNDNFSVIKEQRLISFAQGLNTIKFTDVASSIDPTSVSFECLSSPGKIAVLEQNYEYDLVSTAELLKRYIDKPLAVFVKGSGADEGKTLQGILLAARDNNLILKDDSDSIQIIAFESIQHISLTQLPENLITKPTLVWLAHSEKTGEEKCQVTYTASDISWKADYAAILNADENAFNFNGWVTIDNKSGVTYRDAKIKLIAGDVKRIIEQPPMPMQDERVLYKNMALVAAGFEEKPFMEYHLYTLGRPCTINNNQVKQIEFITPAENVPARKIYLYEHDKNPEKVQIKFEFENKKEIGLGIALPKGKVRVFRKDTDGSLEFVGEDLIDHTPKNEKLALYIGDAFDITAEYKTIESKVSERSSWEKRQIGLHNRKDSTVTIFADEKFPKWVNWKINDSTHPYVKKDAVAVRFTIEVPADSTVTLEYAVTQKW